jgi:hypothetical protein
VQVNHLQKSKNLAFGGLWRCEKILELLGKVKNTWLLKKKSLMQSWCKHLVPTKKKKKKLGPKLATYPISNLFGTSRTWPNFLALKHLFSLCYTNIDKYSLSLLSITTERKKEN